MKTKKTFFALVAAIALIVALACPAFASSGDYTVGANSNGHDFEKAWRAYETGDNGEALLTYGFNMFLIDEDYAWADHSSALHWASLKNDNGWHNGLIKLPGSTSKIEVTHSGSFIYYCCEW